MEILRVSSKSTPNQVAGAIASVIREQGHVEVQAIGAGATNQAVKSIAIARGYILPTGMELVCVPVFGKTPVEGDERTVMRLQCHALTVTE